MQLSKVSLIALAVWPVVMVSAANKIELDPTAETYLAEGKIASCEDFNHETAQCYEYDYQPDQCVPLEYPDRTGDKLSGFIVSNACLQRSQYVLTCVFQHTLAEVRCFLYADSKCDPSPGIGDAMYANSRFTWERDFKATAFKCMPEKESLDESAHVDTSDIDYCAERGEDAKCYTMAYKMGTCKPLEDPKATGDRFSIYTVSKAMQVPLKV